MTRKLAATVATVLASGLLLTACGDDTPTTTPSGSTSAAPSSAAASPSASSSPSASTSVKASTNLDAITVTGAFGNTPKIKIAKVPWAIDKTRVKVLSAGDGPKVRGGTTVDVNYYAVNGRTGKKFDESFSSGAPVAIPLDQVVPGFAKGLVGQQQGSRILVAISGKDGYDSSGGNAQAGIDVGDTLLFVIDVVAVQLNAPDGAAVAPKDGLPTVSDSITNPMITVPKTDPPTSLQTQPLIKGKGDKVTSSDTLIFRYRWVNWSDGKTVETNYGQAPATLAVAGLVPGLAKGLTGQTVGSRVLVVVPPDLGYPDGNQSPNVDKGETLVFVVDLLFASGG